MPGPTKPPPAHEQMAVMHFGGGGFGLFGHASALSATPPIRMTTMTCGEGKEARVLREEECQILCCSRYTYVFFRCWKSFSSKAIIRTSFFALI